MKARMLIIVLLSLGLHARASDHGSDTHETQAPTSPEAAVEHSRETVVSEHHHASPPAMHTTPASEDESEKSNSPVVAMNEQQVKAIRAEKIITIGVEPQTLVDKKNNRYELSPHSVAQFSTEGRFTLLRGSVIAESRDENSLKTNSASIDFIGRVVISYDYKERSTSAFVLGGEARLINPSQSDRTVRLDRFRGASMIVGDVYPQLIRQLDFVAVESWLKGYSWPTDRLHDLLAQLPRAEMRVVEKIPAHLQNAKLEDYFSAIDNAEDDASPDYYDRKFADPDITVAQNNSKKEKKEITPEVAAMIALPSTKIDLDFDLPTPQVLTVKEKSAELRNTKIYQSPKKGRGIASLHAPQQAKEAKNIPAQPHQDPEVNAVLERLKGVRQDGGGIVTAPMPNSATNRSPASAITAVPDPVYDYSENF